MRSGFPTALCFVLLTFFSCSDDAMPDGGMQPTDPNLTIWDGPKIVFTKSDGSDPTNAVNQDKITDNVWITRGNSGGQIFNIKVENSANKTNSPTGTEWAIGTTSNLSNLTFAPFRAAVVSPKDVVGKNLVLHLIEDDVYLDIKFNQWSQQKAGGFAYDRSSE